MNDDPNCDSVYTYVMTRKIVTWSFSIHSADHRTV